MSAKARFDPPFPMGRECYRCQRQDFWDDGQEYRVRLLNGREAGTVYLCKTCAAMGKAEGFVVASEGADAS